MSLPCIGPTAAAQWDWTDRYPNNGALIVPPYVNGWATVAESLGTVASNKLHLVNSGTPRPANAFLDSRINASTVGPTGGQCAVADLSAFNKGGMFIALFIAQSKSTPEGLAIMLGSNSTTNINRMIVMYQSAAGAQTNIVDVTGLTASVPLRMAIAWDPINDPGHVYYDMFSSTTLPNKYIPTTQAPLIAANRPKTGDNTKVGLHLQTQVAPATCDFSLLTSWAYSH